MSERPEFVGDAIDFDDNGQIFGRYDKYILKPVYQPIYEVAADNIAKLNGYEGLVRAELDKETISPEEFFKTVAEEDALFVECLCIALHVRGFHKACIEDVGLFVNVNVANYKTVADIEREFFYTFSQLAKYGLGRNTIVFEILETEVTNPEILLRLCDIISKNGYSFALDDFGTSHSNVERYIAVSPDIIKLDRSLFLTAMQTPETGKLLKSLIAAFQENGVKVLMEGLETAEEMLFSSEMGVELVQGFYLGRPIADTSAVAKQVNLPIKDETTQIVAG